MRVEIRVQGKGYEAVIATELKTEIDLKQFLQKIVELLKGNESE